MLKIILAIAVLVAEISCFAGSAVRIDVDGPVKKKSDIQNIGSVDAPDRIVIEKSSVEKPPEFKAATFFSWHSETPTWGIYYDGPEFQGHATKVFAYMGIPKTAKGETVPGIVLVHGGGGTAYREWVELWVSRGYAAIAMDTSSAIPIRNIDNKAWRSVGRAYAGPRPRDASFKQGHLPLTDQWPYYTVNSIARARTLLGSQPRVDAKRIGITGVSWGGYLVCLAASLDPRYVFAAPVYGCGFLSKQSTWMKTLQQPRAAHWNKISDPSVYLSGMKMPSLWVIGTTDGAYGLESWNKSSSLPAGPVTRSVTLHMPHGHGGHGELPKAIHIMADYYCKGEEELLPKITGTEEKNGVLLVKGTAMRPLTRAELLYTCERESADKKWNKLLWKSTPGEVKNSADGFLAQARIPPNATQYLLNLYDDRDVPFSTGLFTRP